MELALAAGVCHDSLSTSDIDLRGRKRSAQEIGYDSSGGSRAGVAAAGFLARVMKD